jgi:DNA-binding transcriptional MerR regulator
VAVSLGKRDAPLPLQARLKSSGLRIGELAALGGVRASAIRYYEALGLMPVPPRRGGWRVYGAAELERLRMITLGRRLGFSMRELAALHRDGPDAWREAARAKAGELRDAISGLGGLAERLDMLADCRCAAGHACVASQ